MSLNTKLEIMNNIFSPIKSDIDLFNNELIEVVGSNNVFLDKITKYIIQAGGKRIRPSLCYLTAKALDNNISANIVNIALAVELIHTATLIHDDVIDESSTRRNIKTVNATWDSKTAVIAGDYLLSHSLKCLAATKSPEIIELFATTMSEMCIGEIQQAFDDTDLYSIENYLKKSERKTAMLFVAAVKSVVISVTQGDMLIESMESFARDYGLLFQITDDILDFVGNEDSIGKPVGNDLLNGIITAPAIFAAQEDSDLKQLLQNESINNENISEIIETIKNSNGLNHSYELAKQYAQSAVDSLAMLPESQYKASLMNLVDYTYNRKF